MRAFDVGRLRILIARVGDTYHALRDICPHQGAELSRGQLGGTNIPSAVGEYRYGRDGEVIRCPWHSWEFDITTGRSFHDPVRRRVRRYAVDLKDGFLEIEIDDRRRGTDS
jgi:nitrite reductase/ring-hydroxylating ferredoxin subunit